MPPFKKDRTILNMKEVKQELDNAEIYEDEDGNKIQTIYLGSILNLTPSGKVYYPFAHSNVDKCPRCEGTGTIKNKNGKKHNFKRANRKHIELLKKINEYNNWHEAPKSLKNKINKAYKQEQQWTPWTPCTECAGLESLEARLDEDWWKQLENELDTIDAFYHGSDGDGCDVMISRVVYDATESEET